MLLPGLHFAIRAEEKEKGEENAIEKKVRVAKISLPTAETVRYQEVAVSPTGKDVKLNSRAIK